MKDQDQNIAVAKFHGWNGHSDFEIGIRFQPAAVWIKEDDRGYFIPDYSKDLNAMNLVEVMLTEHKGLYWKSLADVVTGFKMEGFDNKNEYIMEDIACASASQRREALLRTLNLWTEES